MVRKVQPIEEDKRAVIDAKALMALLESKRNAEVGYRVQRTLLCISLNVAALAATYLRLGIILGTQKLPPNVVMHMTVGGTPILPLPLSQAVTQVNKGELFAYFLGGIGFMLANMAFNRPIVRGTRLLNLWTQQLEEIERSVKYEVNIRIYLSERYQ